MLDRKELSFVHPGSFILLCIILCCGELQGLNLCLCSSYCIAVRYYNKVNCEVQQCVELNCGREIIEISLQRHCILVEYEMEADDTCCFLLNTEVKTAPGCHRDIILHQIFLFMECKCLINFHSISGCQKFTLLRTFCKP